MCISHKRRGFCGNFLTIEKTGNRIAHFRADCLCWSCPHCTETVLRAEHLAHCQKIGDQQGKLFYLAIPAADWRKVYRRLSGSRYFRLAIGDTYHVFTAKPFDYKNNTAEHYSGRALSKLLERLIAEIPYGKSPWSACHAWKIGKIRTNKGCIILAKSRVTSDSLALAADRNGIKHNRDGSTISLKCDRATILDLLQLARSIQWAQLKSPPMANYPYVTPGRDKDNSPRDIAAARQVSDAQALQSG